jgi:hypothetical protein
LGNPSRRTISAVPSVEPSSTTTMSTPPGWSLRATDRTAAAMPSFSLYAGITTDTGRVTGGPHDQPAAGRCRASRETSRGQRRGMNQNEDPTRTASGYNTA